MSGAQSGHLAEAQPRGRDGGADAQGRRPARGHLQAAAGAGVGAQIEGLGGGAKREGNQVADLGRHLDQRVRAQHRPRGGRRGLHCHRGQGCLLRSKRGGAPPHGRTWLFYGTRRDGV